MMSSNWKLSTKCLIQPTMDLFVLDSKCRFAVSSLLSWSTRIIYFVLNSDPQFGQRGSSVTVASSHQARSFHHKCKNESNFHSLFCMLSSLWHLHDKDWLGFVFEALVFEIGKPLYEEAIEFFLAFRVDHSRLRVHLLIHESVLESHRFKVIPVTASDDSKLHIWVGNHITVLNEIVRYCDCITC